jgi:hypothetical protein
MRYLVMVGLLAIAPAAWADESSDTPDVLDQSPQATTGAQRLGSPEISSPPHMSTGVGQSPTIVTRDDIAREQARAQKKEAKRLARQAEEAQRQADEAARAAQPQP